MKASSPVRVVDWENEHDMVVNADGSLNVVTSGAAGTSDVSIVDGGIVDAGNTSEVLLAGAAVFTGVGVDTLDYAAIILSLTADQPSATDGLEFQFSHDSVVWKTTDNYTYTNNSVCKTYSIQTVGPYFRVVYTNGAVAQGLFNLCTQLKKAGGVGSSHRVDDDIEAQDDASLTKSVISAKRPSGEYSNVNSTPEGDLKVSVVSAFGTLPVAQLQTLHDGKILNRMFPEINEVAGTGTGTYAGNKYNMHVEAGEWSIITTRRHHPYFSGKVQKFEITFDFFAPQADVIKRVGGFSSSTVSPYSSDLDGLWLESSGGTISMKSSRSGVLTIDEDITAWVAYARLKEYQTLGTWDNFTVIEFNYLWLGGAYIELKLVTSDGFVVANNYVYAGTSQDVFMLSPNQPMRYEIRSTGGVGDFRYICNQVATSGSIAESGLSKTVDTGHVPIALASIGIKYPIIGLRKGAAFRDNAMKIHYMGLLVESSDRVLWTVEINPTISDPVAWEALWGAKANTSAEYAVGDGSLTVTAAGIEIGSDTILQGDHIPPALFQNNYLSWLSGALDGTMDEYILCATPKSTNLNLDGSIGFLES